MTAHRKMPFEYLDSVDRLKRVATGVSVVLYHAACNPENSREEEDFFELLSLVLTDAVEDLGKVEEALKASKPNE